jgi:mono/diheme cytochrome c family protein
MLPLLVLFAVLTAAYAGGWATITVLNEFPDYAVAGKPVQLSFMVRQHGQTPLSGLQPSIRATAAGGLSAKTTVTASRTPGQYAAALTLPEPGMWTITITSGFNASEIKLPALRVIAREASAPVPFSPATRGVRLFTAKGCVGCHRHLEVNPEFKTDERFDLTSKRFPPDYLKKFLADPSVKPAEMPNLKLNEEEIEALAAFINKGFQKKVAR